MLVDVRKNRRAFLFQRSLNQESESALSCRHREFDLGATGSRHARQKDNVRHVIREGHLERSRCDQREGNNRHRDEERGTQHHLRARRDEGLPCGVEVALPVCRGYHNEQGNRQDWGLRCLDPAFHRQWNADPGLRKRERSAGF